MTSLQTGFVRALITSMIMATLSPWAFASAGESRERWHTAIGDGYGAPASQSGALESKASSFCAQPTAESRATLEQHWRSAFGAWQAVRFVDFGPVEQNTLT
ncbi:imelysin family protein [Marinobacter changyiensis]|uniref:imelysin family protein n=1 Tax=Marinobacter changyiensis TaxID=2604091 RepID=UPI001263F78E|nr:imelysin family protein [Marinobacter changyiensis]